MKSEIFKYPLMLLLVSIATNCIAESGVKTEVGNIQTPEEFLRVVKNIVESDDLSDYQKISRALGLKVVAMPERDVYINQQEGQGKLIDISVTEIRDQIWERQSKDFSIGIFKPEKKLLQKIWFRGGVRAENICVTKSAIFQKFGYPVREYMATDLGPITDFFDFRKRNWITLEAHFHRAVNSSGDKCLIGIGFSQNIHGSQD